MYLDSRNIDNSRDIYQLLVGSVCPRPIAWVSTLSAAGVANLAPYSFFTVASCDPPVLSVTHINPRDRLAKDTLLNLQDTKECVVNIVNTEQAAEVNATCAEYSHDTSEFLAVGVEQVPGVAVSPPGVKYSKVRYECRLREILSISEQPGGGIMLLLDVVGVHVDDAVFVDGVINTELLDVFGKMGGDYYSYSRQLFELKRAVLK